MRGKVVVEGRERAAERGDRERVVGVVVRRIERRERGECEKGRQGEEVGR